MIPVITTILGFIIPIGKEIAGTWQARKQDAADKVQEIRILELQIEREKLGLATKAQDIDAANTVGNNAIILEQEQHVGFKLMEAYRASVRPNITYGFFGLYAYHKIILLNYCINSHIDAKESVKIVWTQTDEAIWGAIIGFWFSDRLVKTYKKWQQ